MKRCLLIGLLLVVAVCIALTPGAVSASPDTVEITATDDTIAFGTLTASTGNNVVQNSGSDYLRFSTGSSDVSVYWMGEVTSATHPSGTTEASVKTWVYWSDASGERVYPAMIDVNAAGATGCTITEAWGVHGATIPAGGGSETKSAEFTVNYHDWTDSTGDAASTATYTVVFTDSNKVFLKEGGTDWDFTSSSADLTADATALEVSTGAGQKNFLLASDSEPIGDAIYVLTALNTTGGSEKVTFQIGNKFAYTGAAQTKDFYALVDMPNLSPAGDYSWTITFTTAMWDSS